MLSLNKSAQLLAVLFICAVSCGDIHAQACNFSINGTVSDLHTGDPMPYVTVYERSLGCGATTDDAGRFQLDSLCSGGLHLEFRHVGCEAVELFIDLLADTSIALVLHHNAELLGEVEVVGRQNDLYQVGMEAIGKSEIDGRSDEDLTSLLTDITGLSAIQNGSALAKPVYHGMSGNRLTILNNGIAQSGQQWGSDHAPEIDAFAADRLTVIQGAYTLAQNGANLGGMILIGMSPIPKDPHLHGKVNYSFISNGAGHSINTRLEKSGKWAAWRMTITGKKIGDRETPDYFLTNTANQQLNASLLIEKELTSRWRSSVYVSTFNTEIGILRGSHIGNLSDLVEAFSRDVPFFTEESRNYTIGNPRQVVGHHLIKFKNSIRSGIGLIDLTYAGQYNDRQEFDIRRGDREDQAALDINQVDHFVETTLSLRTDSAFSWRTGAQYRYTRNVNDPSTGILPLVPDYLNQMASAFLIADWKPGKWKITGGARYDLKNVYALPISRTLPRLIERKDLWYTSPSGVVTLRYDITEEFVIEGEAGYRQRSPEVNELFSNGLHQGVSGIEEGDDQLANETGYLSRLSGSYHIKEKYFITVSAYQNRIDDYIYLVPQDELRLTIRGAFPLFSYQQVDAILRGVDMTFAVEIGTRWRLRSNYSYLKGRERESGLALVGIPSNTGDVGLQYEVERWKGFQDIHLGIQYSYTSMRADLLTDNETFPDRPADSPLMGQDFLAPPAAYSLVSFDLDATKHIGKKMALNIGLKMDNLLNTSYRDYLDRQRYFADAMGRNVKLKLGWEF
jgi:iron complex outermembrane receptor protein